MGQVSMVNVPILLLLLAAVLALTVCGAKSANRG